MRARRHGQPWTQEELERLRRLAADRRSLNAIAHILERTPIGIKSKATSLGLKISASVKPDAGPASSDHGA